ncbi:MAG: adenine deaminase C-terminal domain-containing protein [Thermodesulfobacteriota bacterium]|nr:adenine deaminase C-terminal domain-containing protein [Thermodesulfobacteriota bacterium]
MKEIEKRKILSEVALGNIPPDTVIANGILFNVFTGEFIKKQSIWIKDGRIAYVGPDHDPQKDGKTQVIDADGMALLPGLIEGHTHLNRSGIEEFVRHVIPGGVTTVIMETIDFGLIAGREGMEYLVKGLEEQPIRFYYTIAPLCGLTPSEEINAPTNEELLPLLKNPQCLGIGEIYWGNIFLEGQQGERVRELASIALEMGKLVEGHTAGASGRKLQAYTDFGVSSCHEPITDEEVLERLRLGYWVMIREGSIRKELPGVAGIFKKKIDFRRLILSTDGVDPEEFLEEGYLDASLRSALKLGVPPQLAYQMVTINVAEHFGLDHLIGSLSPGKMADLLIIPSPEDFSPCLVMCDGKIIFRDGKSLAEPKKVFFPDHMFHTVTIPDDIFSSIKGGALAEPAVALAKAGKVRAMELVSRLVTKESIIDLEKPEESKDVIMILALDRLGSGKAFMGFLKGFGLERGAYGTTMSWDSPDMIVVGCDTQSMEAVIGRLKEIGGGGVYAIGKEIVAEFPAPLCGVASLKPMEIVGEEVKKLEASLRKNGVKWGKPALTVDTLTSPAIPHLRITHKGYVRLKDRKVLPVEA